MARRKSHPKKSSRVVEEATRVEDKRAAQRAYSAAHYAKHKEEIKERRRAKREATKRPVENDGDTGDGDNVSLSSRESDAVLDSPLSKSSDFEDVCNAETVQECLADIRKRAQAWELPYGAVGDWPMMMKISEMQTKDGEPHWIRGGEQLVEWLDTLREHASKGDALLEELSGLVGLPMPREGWMVQDIFRQVIDLTRIITQGVQQVRARLEVAHLHYMPPYSFKTRVYDKSEDRTAVVFHPDVTLHDINKQVYAASTTSVTEPPLNTGDEGNSEK